MKLVDLNPRWWIDGEGRRGMGVRFDCPGACCAGKLSTAAPDEAEGPRRQRIAVAFANPIDGGVPEHLVPHHDGFGHVVYSSAMPEWQRTGETFDTLSLSPSIDVSAHGHWHGFITNGEVK